MDPGTTILVQLVILGLTVLAALISAWYARRNNVRELENTVDDLSSWAEKAIRATRTSRMREVRAASRDNPAEGPPPELKTEAAPGENYQTVKDQLRRRLFKH